MPEDNSLPENNSSPEAAKSEDLGRAIATGLPVESQEWLAAGLERLLDGQVSALTRLSGGASRQTWSFTLTRDASVPQQLILRRDPPAAARIGGMPLEAALFSAAAAAGVPVPELVASGDADPVVLGTGFLIMNRVEGETIARKILRDEPYAHARTMVVRQMGAALAKLHAAPINSVPGLVPLDPLARYREVLDELNHSSPTFELAFRWLEANRPAAVTPVIVHGDFRLGNVIVDEHGLASVLDWELAHLGDPAEDMGWLCVRAWRFGGSQPVAGLGTYADLLCAYEDAGGQTITPERVHWWEVAGTLIWGIMCLLQANAHTSGAIRSVELAAIGRRVSEQEHDLLTLLGSPELNAPDLKSLADSSQNDHSATIAGSPSASLLLEAVQEYLDTDVRANSSGRTQFHSRVAAHVLAMVQRELALSVSLRTAHANTLCALDIVTPDAEQGNGQVEYDELKREAELTAAIRAGRYDADLQAVAEALRPTISLRLAIANPKHFET